MARNNNQPRNGCVFSGFRRLPNGWWYVCKPVTTINQKALALRNNNGYLVLQKHWMTNDANTNQTLQKYNALIDEAINRATLNNWPIDRIVVVDHEKQTSNQAKDYLGNVFVSHDLNADGSLNVYGQSEIGRQLAQATYGMGMNTLLNKQGRFAHYVPPAKYKEDADIRWDQPTNAANAFLYRLNFARASQKLVWVPDHDLGVNNNVHQVAWSMPASFAGQVKGLVTNTTPTVTVNTANQLTVQLPNDASSPTYYWRLLINDQTNAPYYVDGQSSTQGFDIKTTIPANSRWRLKVFTADGKQFPAVYSAKEIAAAPKNNQNPIAATIQKLAATKPDGLVWAAIGDSITQASAYPQGWNGYVQQFINSLREDYGRNKDVFINLAVLGDTTTEEAYYANQRIGRYHPDVIMIALGINDLTAEKTSSLHTGADLDTIINNYKAIISAIRANNQHVPIIISAILPTKYKTISATVPQANVRLKELVTQLNTTQSPVFYFDVYNTMVTTVLANRAYYSDNKFNTFFYGDTVHPVWEGHNWLGTQWLAALGFEIANSQVTYNSGVVLTPKTGSGNVAATYANNVLTINPQNVRAANPGVGSILVQATDKLNNITYSRTLNAIVNNGTTTWDNSEVKFTIPNVTNNDISISCIGFGINDQSQYTFAPLIPT